MSEMTAGISADPSRASRDLAPEQEALFGLRRDAPPVSANLSGVVREMAVRYVNTAAKSWEQQLCPPPNPIQSNNPRESSALFRDALKGSPIRDGDRCSLDMHPTRPLPFAQAFIDALSCRSHDVAQLTLGHLNPISGAA